MAGQGPVPVSAASAGQVIRVLETALHSADERRTLQLG
jgi:hypothetical protein